MTQVIMLIVVLAHGGYWFGEKPNQISLKWNLPAAQIPASEFRWRLQYGKIEISRGSAVLPAGREASSIDLTLPEFRVAADLVLDYELLRGAEVLQSGEMPLHGVPNGLLKESAKLVSKKRLALLDSNEGLASLLKDAGIDVRRIAALSDLQLTSPDVLIVGQDALGDDLAQQDLMDRARTGANVIILAQSLAKQAAGYPLGQRSMRAPLAIAERHPLLIGFSREDLHAWARAAEGVRALQLPADAPALELVYWPGEAPGREAVPIDALMATRTLPATLREQSAGRIVHLQIPMSDWREDPRVSMMLANLLEYTVTRPQPTVPPSQRIPAATQPRATWGKP